VDIVASLEARVETLTRLLSDILNQRIFWEAAYWTLAKQQEPTRD
jgi:hypothetical protein